MIHKKRYQVCKASLEDKLAILKKTKNVHFLRSNLSISGHLTWRKKEITDKYLGTYSELIIKILFVKVKNRKNGRLLKH